MIGSYEDWQNMAAQMRDERDKALDELDRLKAEINSDVARWKALALAPVELFDEDHQETKERAEKAESLLDQANGFLLRWCTAFSMGPLSDQYLSQESKTFLISNYPKHNFHVEPRKP